MQRALLPVVLALVCGPAAAQDIYKCTSGAAVSYQSMPCATGQAETRMHVGPIVARREPPAMADAAPPSRQAPAPRRIGPWRNQGLVLGMSDDEVLNMPAWGRPTHIARSRSGRAWQEVWTYGNAYGGERQLRFVNARLADIGEGSAPQVAQLTLQ